VIKNAEATFGRLIVKLNEYLDTGDVNESPEALVTNISKSVLLEAGDPGVWMDFTAIANQEDYHLSGRLVVRHADGRSEIYDMTDDETELFYTHFFG
jgi:hypothetical protein